jgi:phage terminase small subunit
LSKPVIKEAIDSALEAIQSARVADAKEVMEYLTAVMRREYKECVVVTTSEEISTYVPDEQGTMRKQTVKRETPQIVEIPARLSDANKAAELIGKRYSLFTDKLELTVPVTLNFEDEYGSPDG